MTEKPKNIDDLISFDGLGYQFSETNSKTKLSFLKIISYKLFLLLQEVF